MAFLYSAFSAYELVCMLSFQILVNCIFCLFFLAGKRFASFTDLLKEPVLSGTVFTMVFPLSISSISTQIFCLYFPLLVGFRRSPFLLAKVESQVLDLS